MKLIAEINATIENAFHKTDVDGNGYIDKNELNILIETLEKNEVDKEELTSLFNELDEDSNGKIEYNEFYNWYTSKSAKNKRLMRLAKLGIDAFHIDAFTSAWNGDITTINKFIEDNSFDINSHDESLYGRNNTILHYAAYNNKFYICKLLVENGAKIDSCNALRCTPFYYACQEDNKDIVEFFLGKRIENIMFVPDINGNTPVNVCGNKSRGLLKSYYKFPENNIRIIPNQNYKSKTKAEIFFIIDLGEGEIFDCINIQLFQEDKINGWKSDPFITTLIPFNEYAKKGIESEDEKGKKTKRKLMEGDNVYINEDSYKETFGRKRYSYVFIATPGIKYKCIASISDFHEEEIKEEKSDTDDDGFEDDVNDEQIETTKSEEVIYEGGRFGYICCRCPPVKPKIIKLNEPKEKSPPFRYVVTFKCHECICKCGIQKFKLKLRSVSETEYLIIEINNNFYINKSIKNPKSFEESKTIDREVDTPKEDKEGEIPIKEDEVEKTTNDDKEVENTDTPIKEEEKIDTPIKEEDIILQPIDDFKLKQLNNDEYSYQFRFKSRNIYLRISAINEIGEGLDSEEFPLKPFQTPLIRSTRSSMSRLSKK